MERNNAALSIAGRIEIGQPIQPESPEVFVIDDANPGSLPSLVEAKFWIPKPIFRMLFRHSNFRAARRADWTAGASNDAKTLMIAITTSSSINVKP